MNLFVVIGWHHNGASPQMYGTGMHGDEPFRDRAEAVAYRDRQADFYPDVRFTVYVLEP